MRAFIFIIPFVVLVAIVFIWAIPRRQSQRGGDGSVQIQAGGNIHRGEFRDVEIRQPPKQIEALQEQDLDWLGHQVDLYRKDKDGVSE